MTTVTAPTSSAPARSLPAAWRVEVLPRADAPDPEGERALAALAELGLGGLTSARAGRGYLLSPDLDAPDAQRLAGDFFADPVLNEVQCIPPATAPKVAAGIHRVLVMRRPGVMDPVALTIESLLSAHEREGAQLRALSYRIWEFEGQVEREALAQAAARVFANEVIEEVLVDDECLHFELPGGEARRVLETVQLSGVADSELERISRDGALSLTLVEMKEVQGHYAELGREPTRVELETVAQTWSEHCKHKTFTGIVELEHPDGRVERIDNLLKQTIKRATEEIDHPYCVSVFHDNAGIVEFLAPGEAAGGPEADEGWHLAFKVETHNHPSAIDPYGGAGTGVGGVVRDILGVGLGARPIANNDAFFVGPLDMADEDLPKGCMHPRRILRGVVAGVRDYGNRMGIPTVNGGVWVDPSYVGNPLVFCGTVGLMPAAAAHKSVQPGDAVVVVGGRTGRDGIHGATFSSIELHDESVVVSSAAVQIGDPIQEKRVLDGLLVARDEGLFRAVTDCGAGGLSSAVGEMGETCGAEVDLDLVPLKYPGLTAAEIWISEAQERMVFAVPPENLARMLEVFAAEDVEAVSIGSFTDSGQLVLRDQGEVVGDMSMHFLHDGTPKPLRRAKAVPARNPDARVPACTDLRSALLSILGMPDVVSKEWIVRQYDHEVQGASVLSPLVGVHEDGPGDAAVLQPVYASRKGVALGCGANPGFGLLDPGAMAAAVIDEALRNVVAVGGDPDRTAILDNFAWGNCDRPETLGALVAASQACYEAAIAYGTPFISGKDSLNNEFKTDSGTLSIPPTLLVSAMAEVPDVARAVSMDLKRAGNRLVLVGMTHDELGGSHYARLMGVDGGRVPRPDLTLAPRAMRALHSAQRQGLVASCHDLSEGGLLVSAAEMAFAGGLGARIDLSLVPSTDGRGQDPTVLRAFSESCTRWLLEVEPEKLDAVLAAFETLDAADIGQVTAGSELEVVGTGETPPMRATLADLRAAHQGGFQG